MQMEVDRQLTNNTAFDEALDWGPAVITIQARHFQ